MPVCLVRARKKKEYIGETRGQREKRQDESNRTPNTNTNMLT